MIDTTDYKTEAVKVVSIRISLYREDALALIRSLATHGEHDATMILTVWESDEGHNASASIDGGMGPILSVNEVLVRVSDEVTV
jgi:hypothetical protein